MTAINKRLKIGISVGDINGIGLEVALKTLADKRILQWCTPVIYGSTKVVSYHKNIAKIKDLPLHNTSDAQSLNPNAINVVNCWMENVKITLGKCSADGGKYATFSLDQATEDLKAGYLDALVTAPIHKKAMQESGFAFPGHTEYLTSKFQAPLNLMLLVNESLRVGLVTNHLPIKEVSAIITQQLVLEKIRLMNKTLRMDFGIDRPAIAVLGLNPHAGDGGVLGSEETEHILPAIEQAKQEGILAIGPYAADGFFGSGNYLNYDGILAMYHDQGLVPFKALSFGKGINFTAGLPIIRTSPDHGTGFDIAGKNTANHQSFREALYLAMDSARQRAEFLEMHKNPLPVHAKNHDNLEEEDSKGSRIKNKRERNDRSKRSKNEGRKEQKTQSKEGKSKQHATPKGAQPSDKAPKKESKPTQESPKTVQTPTTTESPIVEPQPVKQPTLHQTTAPMPEADVIKPLPSQETISPKETPLQEVTQEDAPAPSNDDHKEG